MHLALVDGQVEAVECPHLAEVLGQASDFDGGGAVGSFVTDHSSLDVTIGMPAACWAMNASYIVESVIKPARVDLEGGQHHLLGVVVQHGPDVGWVVVHLQVQQEAAAAGHRQELGPGLGVWARP